MNGEIGRERRRKRSERRCKVVDKVKLHWSYLCFNIRCMYHRSLHHFQIQNHFSTPASFLTELHSTINSITSIKLSLFLYHLLYFFLGASAGPPCAQAMERLYAQWFTPAFSGASPKHGLPLLLLFSSLLLFFWYHFFPAWRKCLCVFGQFVIAVHLVCLLIFNDADSQRGMPI